MEEPEVHNNKGSQSEKTVHCNPRLHGIPENSKTTEILKCLLVSKVYVWGGGGSHTVVDQRHLRQ